MPDLAWMAWTWQTGLFFAGIASLLVIMTLLAIYRPETERVGILRIPTTRGDRLFSVPSMLDSLEVQVLYPA